MRFLSFEIPRSDFIPKFGGFGSDRSPFPIPTLFLKNLQQSHGNRDDDRACKQPDYSESLHSTEQREKDEQRVKFNSPTEHEGPDNVVRHRDEARTPDDHEDGLAPIAD